jgi:hypothetical protein
MSCPQPNWLRTKSKRELHEGGKEEQCENANKQKCHDKEYWITRVRILGPRLGLKFDDGRPTRLYAFVLAYWKTCFLGNFGLWRDCIANFGQWCSFVLINFQLLIQTEVKEVAVTKSIYIFTITYDWKETDGEN